MSHHVSSSHDSQPEKLCDPRTRSWSCVRSASPHPPSRPRPEAALVGPRWPGCDGSASSVRMLVSPSLFLRVFSAHPPPRLPAAGKREAPDQRSAGSQAGDRCPRRQKQRDQGAARGGEETTSGSKRCIWFEIVEIEIIWWFSQSEKRHDNRFKAQGGGRLELDKWNLPKNFFFWYWYRDLS